MGGKESKHFPISYDEAVKRVSETEKRRLQDAFRRSAGTSSSISKQVEILSETKTLLIRPSHADLHPGGAGGVRPQRPGRADLQPGRRRERSDLQRVADSPGPRHSRDQGGEVQMSVRPPVRPVKLIPSFQLYSDSWQERQPPAWRGPR